MPIKYEEYKDMNTTQVADMVRTRIIEKIKKEEKVKFQKVFDK